MKKSCYTAIRILTALLIIAQVDLYTFAQSGRKARPVIAEKSKREVEEDIDDVAQRDTPLVDTSIVSANDDGVLKVDTLMVTVPVSVSDKNGRFISNLRRRDFQLYEDGIKQTIDLFSSEEVPFHVILLLDTSSSAKLKLETIHEAAIAFIKQLRKDEVVKVVSFDQSVSVWSNFTNDQEKLISAVKATKTGTSTKLYEAVDLSLKEFFESIDGRKAVVLFTDGVDTSSGRSTARSTLNAAEEANILVYSIRYNTEMDQDKINQQPKGPGQPPPSRFPIPFPGGGGNGNPWPEKPPGTGRPFITYQLPQKFPKEKHRPTSVNNDYIRAEMYLKDLSERSGGRYYDADTLANIDKSFADIAQELRHQYSIGYYPSNGKRDGTFRRVRVKVDKPPDAIVQSKNGYRAATEDKADPTAKDKEENKKRPGYKRKDAR